MILPSLSMILCSSVMIWVQLTLSVVQVIGAIPELYLCFALILTWLAGVGFALSAKWFYKEYGDYRFEKQLKKGFEK